MIQVVKKSLWSVALLLTSLTGYAQTDVTKSYLNNPSFEDDSNLCTSSSSNKVTNSSDGLRGWNIAPQGWTHTTPGVSLLISADCFTDNNFGKTNIKRLCGKSKINIGYH